MLKPPFRADHVGSLLRPNELAKKRQEWRDERIPLEVLRDLEDEHISKAIKLQEEIGLKAITDGEFRRDYWHLDFLSGFKGINLNQETYGHSFSGGDTVATFSIDEKIGPHSGSMRRHFTFLKENTQETAKFCIPGPGMTHLRSGSSAINRAVYPDIEEYWSDLTKAYNDEINKLANLGCTYLQIDDVSFAYLCDKKFREGIKERGDNPDELLLRYASAITNAVKNRPESMTVTVHMCRGNFKSTYMTSGGYESIAENMFNELKVDGYFMEYDTERSGGFEPLKYAPSESKVVLGLITSKTPVLEDKDDIKRRIDEAAKFMDLQQMCLSPQCGFSSTHHGNELTIDQQCKKLELVVEIAEEIWNGR